MTRIKPFGDIARAKLVKATSRALYLALSEIQSTAVNLAPFRQGDLRTSATITVPTVKGNRVGGGISFPLVYAGVQHENESFNHPRGGEAKYLQKAADAHKPRLAAYLDREINR